MPHAHHLSFESFSISAALILAAWVYVRGWLRVRRFDLEDMDGWRAGSCLMGLFCIWVAVASPAAALDHELLTAHMVQHLLLMTVAPPLIWLGTPIMPFFHGLPSHFLQVVTMALLRWPPVQILGKAISHPAVCWLGAAGVLVGWHIPAIFMLALHSAGWHLIEQVSFLAAGLLFWWPVIQPWQTAFRASDWSIVLYLFLATLPCDILSGFLVFCDRVVYPGYLSSSRTFGISVLEDQQCAGALMWTCVTVIYLIAGAIFTARLLSPQKPRGYSVRWAGVQRLESQSADVVPRTG